jgi:hypothetical protein
MVASDPQGVGTPSWTFVLVVAAVLTGSIALADALFGGVVTTVVIVISTVALIAVAWPYRRPYLRKEFWQARRAGLRNSRARDKTG